MLFDLRALLGVDLLLLGARGLLRLHRTHFLRRRAVLNLLVIRSAWVRLRVLFVKLLLRGKGHGFLRRVCSILSLVGV